MKTIRFDCANGLNCTLDGDAKPSDSDMDDMIDAHTTTGEEFQALADASMKFPTDTNENFWDACEAWAN